MGQMLTSLGVGSNAKTVVLELPFVYLLDRSNLGPVNSMKITFVLVVFCTLSAFTNGSAQIARKATDKPAETKSSKTTSRSRERYRVRTPVTSPATIESDRFLDLGDSFRKEGKWNAAEAAYKESITVWPSNAYALRELGFFYLDRNRLSEAQGVYSKLRAVDSSVAAELLADINRYKAASR